MTGENKMKISKEQVEILKHTRDRAANRLYCGDSPDMQELIELGYMRLAGRKSFVPDEYFTISRKGLELISNQ